MDRDGPISRVRRQPPAFVGVRVVRIDELSRHLLRVVVSGESLDAYAVDEPGASLRLLLPVGGSLVMPRWTGNQFELPDGGRAPIRTLTPRRFDRATDELTVDIVVHPDGALSRWAQRAEIGEEVAVSGPGRGYQVEPSVGSYLLAGDETAIPAISQLLERLPHTVGIDAHIEVRFGDAAVDLPTHPMATITWHRRTPGGAPGDALVAAVSAIDELPDRVWAAGEAASMQRLRSMLFDERGMSRQVATVRGYWKHGRPES